MKRTLFLYGCLILAFNTLIISCSKEFDNTSEMEVFRDIIKNYDIMEKIEPTTLIDFTSNQSKKFLLNGWSITEKTHTWAEGLESNFYFFSTLTNNDKEMKITCAPFVFQDCPNQSLDIYLNGTHVETIVLTPQLPNYQLREYKISLPCELMKIKNIVSFKYKYAERPSDHLPNSKDSRRLSVMFRNVSFTETQHILLKRGKIFQKEGSVLNCYERIPEDAKLRFHFEGINGDTAKGCVTVESPRYKPKSQIFKKSGYYCIDLSEYRNRITRISFSARSNGSKRERRPSETDHYDIKWSDIILYNNRKGTEESHYENRGKFRAIKEQLRDYDVVYIVLDAFVAKHSSAYGYHQKTSPTIDALASKGVLFENMFSPAPYTLASTASLFTSRYPFEHQLVKEDQKLNQSLMTIARKLSDSGVETYCVSSNPFVTETWGLTNGFRKFFYERDFGPDSLVGEILPGICDSKKIGNGGKSFVYIHIMPPHSPYSPPQRFRVFFDNESTKPRFSIENLDLGKIDSGEVKIGRDVLEYMKSQYDANILYADEYIRKIVTYLKKKGVIDNIIVIVTSDHGEAFMEHGRLQHNSTVYDEMIHVPFIIKFPEAINFKNIRVGKLASLIDVAPTLLDIMGVEKDNEFRGNSLLPAIIEDKEVRELVYSGTEEVSISRTVRNTNYKYIYNPSAIDELYDLTKDPLERENIIHENPIIGGYYSQKLREIEKGTKVIKEGEINKVDLKKVDKEKIQQLKDLGYMR